MSVTTAGKDGITDLVGDVNTIAAYSYLAVGTGTTAVAAGNTTLGAETTTSGLARAAATVTQATTTVSNDTLQFVKAWTVTGTVVIGEVGIFNATAAGSLLARSVLSPTKSVSSGDTYTLTYKVAFA